MDLWKERIYQLTREMSKATETEIGWKLVEDISAKGAELLKPIFDEHKGRNGRLSIPTDPALYRDARAIVEQAVHFSGVAPNMIVKIPATKAGVAAIEEATYRGVSIKATVSFTVPQCVAVAEAVERGLHRREKDDLEIASMGPVCTIMVGRIDDWLKVTAEKQDVITDPGYLEWAGVAVFKNAYRIFKEWGYRLRLLSAAFRNHMHWSEFVGGEVVISPPRQWQLRHNASDVEVEDFDGFGATVRTLRQFIAGTQDLATLIRNFMLPDPVWRLGFLAEVNRRCTAWLRRKVETWTENWSKDGWNEHVRGEL